MLPRTDEKGDKEVSETTANKPARPGQENLVSIGDRSTEKQREIQSMGGIASGESKRKKKQMKETLQMLAKLKPNDKITAQISAQMGLAPDEITNATAVAVSVYNQALKGNMRASEAFMKAIDEDQEEGLLEIKRAELKIKQEQHQMEMEQYQRAMEGSSSEYRGIPALAIAPCYAQLQFDIAYKKYNEFVLHGGRGSAKSSDIGLDVVDLIEKNPDYNALVLRKVTNTIKDSVYNQIVWAIDYLGLNNEYKCVGRPAEITKQSTGQKIFFRGADDPMKIKSIKPTHGYIAVLWFEELDQFAGEEEIRNIRQSAIRGGSDSFVFMSFNPPKSALNWANKYVKIPKENRLVIKTDYTMVPKEWLGQAFIDEAEWLKESNPSAYEHEYMGIANGNGGNVFENVEVRQITDEEIRNFDRVVHGVDWGWYPDPFAFTTCHYDAGRMTLYIYEEYRCNKKGNRETADVLINDFKIGADLVTCDSAEQKSVDDYRTYGISARGAEKGPGSVDYSMKWLASLNKIVIDPNRCPETVKEFVEYEYERDKEGNVITGYPDKNNHSIDAVRYATNSIWKKRGQ